MDFSLLAAVVFYFIMLGLITYWLACKTVAAIKTWQKLKCGSKSASVIENMVLGSPTAPSVPGGQVG